MSQTDAVQEFLANNPSLFEEDPSDPAEYLLEDPGSVPLPPMDDGVNDPGDISAVHFANEGTDLGEPNVRPIHRDDFDEVVLLAELEAGGFTIHEFPDEIDVDGPDEECDTPVLAAPTSPKPFVRIQPPKPRKQLGTGFLFSEVDASPGKDHDDALMTLEARLMRDTRPHSLTRHAGRFTKSIQRKSDERTQIGTHFFKRQVEPISKDEEAELAPRDLVVRDKLSAMIRTHGRFFRRTAHNTNGRQGASAH
jgi:hypothetical protein